MSATYRFIRPEPGSCASATILKGSKPAAAGAAAAAAAAVTKPRSLGPSSANGAGGGPPPPQPLQQQQRPRSGPRIPPLPYWCEAVTVVGLPYDELVFCFQTPAQASATKRRQVRPEAAYGGQAIRLASLAGGKVSPVLDRWQYACANRELAKLDVRPPLFWTYQSAARRLAKDAQLAAAAAAAAAGKAPSERPTPAADADGQKRQAKKQRQQEVEDPQPQARQGVAAQQQGEPGGAAGAAPSLAEQHSSEVAADAQDGVGAAQRGLRIAQSAFAVDWEVCTVHAAPDGSIIFKFASDGEPLSDQALQPSPATRSRRQRERRLLLRQSQLRSQEGVSWSHTLRMGINFPYYAEKALDKLQAFVQEWMELGSSNLELNFPLFLSHEEAASKQGRRARQLGEAEQADAAAAETARAAAGVVRWGQPATPPAQLQREQPRAALPNKTASPGRSSSGSSSRSPDSSSSSRKRSRSRSRKTSGSKGSKASGGESDDSSDEGKQSNSQPSRPAVTVLSDSLGSTRKPNANGSTPTAASTDSVPVQQGNAAVPSSRQRGSSRDGPIPAYPEAGMGGLTDEQADHSLVQQLGAAVRRLHAQQQTAPSQGTSVQRGISPEALPSVVARRLSLAVAALQARLPAAATAAAAAVAAAVAWELAPPSLVVAVGHICLALYRLTPAWFRGLFWRSWPPRMKEAHASPSLSACLAGGTAEADPQVLKAAGYDNQGQMSAPLLDLPAWRLERLTLCGVRDVNLYRTALTHRLALPQELRLEKSFERLEFLGDAVLGLCCRDMLVRRRPDSDEGEMTRLNSRLVSGAANARYAAFLGLDRYLALDARSFREGAQHKPALLADAFEALLGALFLDRGFAAAQRFCMRVLEACVEWEELEAARDYKALLWRYAASQRKPQPRFAVRSLGLRKYKAGLQLPWWQAEVVFHGRVMGQGGSFERRGAEQAAARQALQQLGQLEAGLG